MLIRRLSIVSSMPREGSDERRPDCSHAVPDCFRSHFHVETQADEPCASHGPDNVNTTSRRCLGHTFQANVCFHLKGSMDLDHSLLGPVREDKLAS
jgi:hypothetical protein